MRIPELQVAMPVRAAADGQAQALSDARESPLGAGGVARVTHLEAVETLLLELADLAVRAVVAEVSGDGDATDRVHQLGDLLQRRERLLDVRRPAPAQIARKGFVHVDAYAMPDQKASHVGAPQRPAVRRLHDVSEIARDAQPAEVPHDLLGATVACGPGVGEDLLEPGLTRRQKVREQVELAPRRLHAELTTRHDAHPERLPHTRRLGNAAG